MCKYLLLLLFAFLLIGSCSAYPDYNKYSNVPTQKSDNMYTPYNETDEAETEINYLLDIIKNEQKHGLIVFGANWCPDARLLEATLQLPSVRQFLDTKCNILNVDVGDYEINTELFKYFDPEIETGIPRVFILDVNGQALNMDSNDKMRTARQQSPQEIFDYFQSFVTGN